MSTLTERNREVAYGMFSTGETSERVARRIRQTVESVRALRANWTRSNSSTSTTSSRVSAPAKKVQPLTINVSRTKLQEALKNGQPVQLVIK